MKKINIIIITIFLLLDILSLKSETLKIIQINSEKSLQFEQGLRIWKSKCAFCKKTFATAYTERLTNPKKKKRLKLVRAQVKINSALCTKFYCAHCYIKYLANNFNKAHSLITLPMTFFVLDNLDDKEAKECSFVRLRLDIKLKDFRKKIYKLTSNIDYLNRQIVKSIILFLQRYGKDKLKTILKTFDNTKFEESFEYLKSIEEKNISEELAICGNVIKELTANLENEDLDLYNLDVSKNKEVVQILRKLNINLSKKEEV